MTFCTNCGIKLDDNVKFCAQCGAPLEADTPPVQTQPLAGPPYIPVPVILSPAGPQYIPAPARKATRAGLRTVQVLSTIGLVLYLPVILVGGKDRLIASGIVMWFGLFALAHAIVSVVQGSRHQIGVLKVMGIIGIVWFPFGWIFEISSSLLGEGMAGIGIMYPLAFAVTALVTATRALNRLRTAAQQSAHPVDDLAPAVPGSKKKQIILTAIIVGVCLVVAANFIIARVTTESDGVPGNPLRNTTWTTGTTGMAIGDLGYEDSETLEFSGSGYVREETSNLSFFLKFSNKEIKDKGSYTLDGDTVIFTPSDGGEYTGALIGNTLIIGSVTFRKK